MGMLTKDQIARLKEIKAEREAARARRDWTAVVRSYEDERWVLRAEQPRA